MKKKLFCDIDDTIADHFSLYKKFLNKKSDINLLKLKPIKYSRLAFKTFNKYYDIYFITRRKSKDKKITIYWLKKNNFSFKKVFFVKNDQSKLNFIIRNNGFIYIDDLKYNYENLKPKIKTRLIKKINQLDLNFFRFSNNWLEIKKKILKNIF
jgi:hypothetical protein